MTTYQETCEGWMGALLDPQGLRPVMAVHRQVLSASFGMCTPGSFLANPPAIFTWACDVMVPVMLRNEAIKTDLKCFGVHPKRYLMGTI